MRRTQRWLVWQREKNMFATTQNDSYWEKKKTSEVEKITNADEIKGVLLGIESNESEQRREQKKKNHWKEVIISLMFPLRLMNKK